MDDIARERIDLTKLNSISDVPKAQIFETSADGLTIVTLDGTKVSDALIAQAKSSQKASAKAASAAAGEGKVSDKERESIIEEAKAAGVKAAQDEFTRLQADAGRSKK